MKKNIIWRQGRITALFVVMLMLLCFLPLEAADDGMQAAQVTQEETQTSEETAAESSKKTKKTKKASVRITKRTVSLEKGETKKLKAKVKNSPKKKIIWKSSKKKVASINKNGKVTAKKQGTTVITARIAGTDIKATAVVRVKDYITMRVRTTGYCNCRKCCGKWAGGRTASGTIPKANRTIAVDKRLISFGTKVGIGNKIYVAEDTGGAIKGKRIDIYYSSHRKAQAHGVKYQTVRIYLK